MLSNAGIILISIGAVAILSLIGRIGRPHYPVFVVPLLGALLVPVGIAGYALYHFAGLQAGGPGTCVDCTGLASAGIVMIGIWDTGLSLLVGMATALVMILLLRRRTG